jgi:hypothetical protein
LKTLLRIIASSEIVVDFQNMREVLHLEEA